MKSTQTAKLINNIRQNKLNQNLRSQSSQNGPKYSANEDHYNGHIQLGNEITQKTKNKSNSPLVQQQIKQHLKILVQQKDLIKKLMISCILSSLYIEQYNYQESHKILTQIKNTIEKLQSHNNKTNSTNKISRHASFQLCIIKIKMYTNFILINIVNLQQQSFQSHLSQVFEIVLAFKRKITQNKCPIIGDQQEDTQNCNPNLKTNNKIQQKKARDTTILLFKLFLKGLSGFQSFETLKAQTLIAQCNVDRVSNSVKSFFYFSNMSFLKLLSSQDFGSAYKLQARSYEIIQKDITNSKKNSEQVTLKQVILKTICLRKLIYLSEYLQLPNEVIKKYKQQMNSSECLSSKYLNGLQENTIFRNFQDKIDLGFQLVSRLKQFQKQVILPILFTEQTSQSRFQQKRQKSFELWQFKALKNKFVQVLCSKSLQRDKRTKENIVLMIDCLSRAISSQKRQIYTNTSKDTELLSAEQMILLESIKQTKQSSKFQQSKGCLVEGRSLYEKAKKQYSDRVQILISSLSNILIEPYLEPIIQALVNSSSERHISYKLSDNDSQHNERQTKSLIRYQRQQRSRQNSKQNRRVKSRPKYSRPEIQPQSNSINYESEQDSEPSIYLQDVEVQVIDKKKSNKKDVDHQIFKNTAINHTQKQYQAEGKPNRLQNNKHSPQPYHFKQSKNDSRQVYNNQNHQAYNIGNNAQSNVYERSRLQKSPKKSLYHNNKNQVYLNYTELGSRVKLNQMKPGSYVQSPKYIANKATGIQKMYKNFEYAKKQTKKYKFNESITKQQGQIQKPNEQSDIKFFGKKYPFENKQGHYQTPLSIITRDKNQKQQVLDNFNYQNKNKTYFQTEEKNFQVKSIDQKSLNRSRKKNSSLSPRVPKDSTICSKLNQHIVKHQLTYSPSSGASLLKLNKQKQLQMQKSENLSVGVSQKSRPKNKSKVQKAARLSRRNPSELSKNPTQLQSQFKNQTIKFKDYMENLQKSGIQVKEQEQMKRNPSRPKLQSHGQYFKSQFKHKKTQSNQIGQEKYTSQISEPKQNNYNIQPNHNILEYFFSQVPNQRFARVQKGGSDSSKGSSPDVNRTQVAKSLKDNKDIKSSQNKTINLASEMGSNDQKRPLMNKTTKNNANKQVEKSFSSEIKTKQKIALPFSQVSLIQQFLSPNQITDYVMKMMKSHKQKLKEMIRLCQNGQYVDKKHYSSDGGQERFLQLSSNHQNLQWAVSEEKLISGNKSKYEIKNIRGVVFGKVTQTMIKAFNKNLQPYKCVSFIFQKRTFDMYIPDEQDSKFWLPGISHFVGLARPQLKHPNYTTNIEKFIKRKQKNKQRDQIRSNQAYYSIGRVLWKRALLKMQHMYLTKSKKVTYKNRNAGAIIQFGYATMGPLKSQPKKSAMLPPTGKQSRSQKQKSQGSVMRYK